IVLGCYYITKIKEGEKGENKAFGDPKEAILAYENEIITLKSKIRVRLSLTKDSEPELVETCVGRIFFNNILPEEMSYVNKILDKKEISNVISQCIREFGDEVTVKMLDQLKSLGFKYLTVAGISWGMDDLQVPKEKKGLLDKASKEVEEVRQQYKAGFLTDDERYIKTIEVWSKVKEEITKISSKILDEHGPVYSMVESGARGSWPQIVQMMGMRGLMAAPSGKTIELPVRDSFKEGLGVLEYFISTHGARKGLSDTALRTANAGYLTRRLVDVSQDVIIYDDDCHTKEGLEITKEGSEILNQDMSSRIMGRVLSQTVKHPENGKVLLRAGDTIDEVAADIIVKNEVKVVYIRSVLTCRSIRGVCSKCYGWDLGSRLLVKVGEAVGVVAAESIGEPGTQLTMRTFHTGGVAGDGDITQGLPRVEELFEARGIKKPALISEMDGIVDVEEDNGKKIVRVVAKNIEKADLEKDTTDMQVKVKDRTVVEKGDVIAKNKHGREVKAPFAGIVKVLKGKLEMFKEGNYEKKYIMPGNAVLWVKKGDLVAKGQQMSEGSIDLQSLFKTAGRQAVQEYVLKEVQFIYSSQGQDVNDKHVEIIVRQMLSKVKVKDIGDSHFLAGDVIDRAQFIRVVDELKKEGKKPPTAEALLLGITKASLSTESFLSAASFQETARVLIDAAIAGKVDHLRSLKENVIIGKLIPVGSAFRKAK
ncbi:DNA-directed RNA polymerase subunit beta', partial [Patescibacteria group bacterium]|nr:DNA-directed RNA polymerase subunit beta' [Patescibacteria group bacterium]